MTREKPIRAAQVFLFLFALAPTALMATETVDPGETVQFEKWDDCYHPQRVDKFPRTRDGWCISPNRMEAFAFIFAGLANRSIEGRVTQAMEFDVSSGAGDGNVLDATVSGKVKWQGVLFGAGILGAETSFRIEAFLVDETAGVTKGQTVVVTKKQESTGIKGVDVGGTRVSGNKSFSFPATVVRGHRHSIRLKLTCEVETGIIGGELGCLFTNDTDWDFPADKHVKWNELSLTVAQDDSEEMAVIQYKLDEIIRLLHTRRYDRSSDIPACDGNPCSYPDTH